MDPYTQQRLDELREHSKSTEDRLRAMEAQVTGLTWLARRGISLAVDREPGLAKELVAHLRADFEMMSVGVATDTDARTRLTAAQRVMTDLLSGALSQKLAI